MLPRKLINVAFKSALSIIFLVREKSILNKKKKNIIFFQQVEKVLKKQQQGVVFKRFSIYDKKCPGKLINVSFKSSIYYVCLWENSQERKKYVFWGSLFFFFENLGLLLVKEQFDVKF